ncbi:MAG TPA: TerC/Alx family metal homeostasis membrane protein [Kofleriaceae bacterium]
MTVPSWAWALLAGLVVLCLIIDLVAHRGDHVDSKKRAFAWSLGWIAVAVGFGVFVTLWRGGEAGEQWFAAYLLEKSLSIDNLFLFVVVFGALSIPRNEQRRVLTWGILGALATRAIFIFTGVAVLERWHWISYVFGGILIITALKLLGPEKHGPPRALTWIGKFLPTTTERHGHHFIAREHGRRVLTPLFVALIAIELSDILFAIDSIPAAFAITEDRFILYSSNVFAILGMRALYVVLEHALEHLRYLKYGLVIVLGFAGAKLLLAPWVHIPALASVAIIAGVIGTVVVASSIGGRDRSRSRSAPEPSPAPHPATPAP